MTVAGRHFNPQSICVVADWDIDTENLAEKQYRALAHDTVRGGGDPKVKPNLQDKEQIERLVQMAGSLFRKCHVLLCTALDFIEKVVLLVLSIIIFYV